MKFTYINLILSACVILEYFIINSLNEFNKYKNFLEITPIIIGFSSYFIYLFKKYIGFHSSTKRLNNLVISSLSTFCKIFIYFIHSIFLMSLLFLIYSFYICLELQSVDSDQKSKLFFIKIMFRFFCKIFRDKNYILYRI